MKVSPSGSYEFSDRLPFNVDEPNRLRITDIDHWPVYSYVFIVYKLTGYYSYENYVIKLLVDITFVCAQLRPNMTKRRMLFCNQHLI